jgi:CBS domain-containing protein
MEKSKGLSDWVPLITKLVWPFFTIVFLLIFNQEVREVYNIVLNSMRAGRSVEIGGFLKLGEAAKETQIADLSNADISIKGIGGQASVTRKGTSSDLRRLLQELEKNPSKRINTLLLTDEIIFSVRLLKEYVGTLGLRFVVFQRQGEFEGWIQSSTFVAQLPETDERPDADVRLNYDELKNQIIGLSRQTVGPDGSAKEVLAKMQDLQIDSIPVVNAEGQWLFFASREEILASLISKIILEKQA